MRNIQLIIEYDGTNYCGWQIQRNGMSIQEKVNNAIEQIIKSPAHVIGSGRTDAGVHALGQSANFKTTSTIPTNRIPMALNSALPKDIRVLSAAEKNMEFHSRYSATGKIYEYRVLNNQIGSALYWNKVLHVKEQLDIESMKCAATYFIGTYDFIGFSSTNSNVKDTIRTIKNSEIKVNGEEILYTIEGSGFLYNMVRIIVGTLIKVGMGKLNPQEIPQLIQSKDRSKAGPTAAAHGLYLREVLY